jgi:predicted enzyme involved in methoxymalonyl-ACP biosynthesis
VMGRKVEETLAHLATVIAHEVGARTVRAELITTAKNGPCLAFWRRSGWAVEGEDQSTFVWELGDPYPLPAGITLDRSS